MISFIRFWIQMFLYAFKGSYIYYAWTGFLSLLVFFGVVAYRDHILEGLIITNLSDHVSWGISIANFTYFVGVAAGAVILMVPAYIYHHKDVKEIVLIGELLAVNAVVMCLLFIFTDIGRPDRFWHLIPPFGKLNLPSSLLAWDVVVFNGYLFLSLHIPSYLLYKEYLGKEPNPWLYIPFIFISIGWAVSIHTVTAFLFSGFGTRHYWNTAIMAPRFLISAFISAPAILILIFSTINRFTDFKVKESVFEYLKYVLRIALPINFFLLGCELFKEFYTGTLHISSAQYLYFGLHGYYGLVKFIWVAIVLNIIATGIFLVPRFYNHSLLLHLGCLFTIVGIWTEKGIGLVFPGFIPSPLGDIIEYIPNMGELLVCVGVLALGLLSFTVMTKIALAIHTGRLRYINPLNHRNNRKNMEQY